MEALNMAGWRDKAEKAGGMRDCKTLFGPSKKVLASTLPD